MEQSNSSSKPKIAVLAAAIYTVVMGIAMFYMREFQGITYGEPQMLSVLWIPLVVLNLLNGFWVIRHFSWRAIGFRCLHRQQLVWLLPSIAVLTAMWVVLLTGLSQTSLTADQWQLLALTGFTTLLVGFGEEIMYRGIVLHGFLPTQNFRWAMLVSAIAFSLLHAVNVFGGLTLVSVPFQLLTTFLFGFFFAPLMLKLNNILPLIIFHWLWDFVLIAAPLAGEQIKASVGAISLFNIPIELVLGIVLWLQLKQVSEDAIAASPNSSQL